MKILFYEVRHFSPNFHCSMVLSSLVRKQYLPKKKIAYFSPKIGEEKKLSKSVSGYYKTKKKVAWTTKPLV